jgi:hypothetical protein
MERRHIVAIRRMELYPQQRTRPRSIRRVQRLRHRRVLRRRRLVQYGRVFERTEVKGPEGAVRTDGDEDVGAAREPVDVVHGSVVCDELGDGLSGLDIPDGTGGVDGGCHDPGIVGTVPREGGEGRVDAVAGFSLSAKASTPSHQ